MKKVGGIILTIALIVGARFLIKWITAPECSVCEDTIMDTAYRADGKIYCKEHKPAGFYR